jgi:2-succinyl-5-enolpyruvyl-6-hydroxy-3-cyclohexene-1-carboxylate synthase
LVVLGNSLPLRVFDTFITARRERIHCLSQRGANGIDGGIAVACGAASTHAGHTVLLLGDVAFLHDVGSLKIVWDLKPNLTIVVLNNRGGRLFEQLPIAADRGAAGQSAYARNADAQSTDARSIPRSTDDAALAPWLTPHDVDLYRLGHAYRLVSYRVGSKHELDLALGLARTSELPSLIEVMVAPSGTSNTLPLLVESVRAGLRAAFG